MEKPLSVLVPEKMTEETYEALYEAINTGRLMAFTGSGLSRPYGGPSWQEFVDAMTQPRSFRHSFGESVRL
jgi:hypothetical protein